MPRTNEPQEISAEVRTLLPLIIAVKDDRKTWRRVVGTPHHIFAVKHTQARYCPKPEEAVSCLVRAANPTRSERIIVPKSEWEYRLLLEGHDAIYTNRYVYTAAEGLHMTYLECTCPRLPCGRHPYLTGRNDG